jgi:hypothetical protein
VEDREQLSRGAERPERLLRAAFLLLALAPLAAGAEDWSEQHRRAVEDFYQADGDRDGKLEPLEATELAPAAFQAADRDRDGKLGLVEGVDARFDALGAPRPPAPQAEPKPLAPVTEP